MRRDHGQNTCQISEFQFQQPAAPLFLLLLRSACIVMLVGIPAAASPVPVAWEPCAQAWGSSGLPGGFILV